MTMFEHATIPDLIVFGVASLMTLAGAIGVVASRNPIYSALGLIVTLFGVAVLFVEQNAHFLAAAQVIIYAGAIVVLFLFVIMLLGVDRSEPISRNRVRFAQPFAILIGVAVVALAVAIGNKSWSATGMVSQSGPLVGDGSNVARLADALFTKYLFLFEIISVLLVIAVVGAVVLARRPALATPDFYDDEYDSEPDNASDAIPAAGDDSDDLDGTSLSGDDIGAKSIAETKKEQA